MYEACKLHMMDGSVIVIPTREDGYIFGTRLCNIARKRIDKWRSSYETCQILAYMKSAMNMEESDIIHVVTEGPKDKHGTWVHPDLGVQLAQYCSPIFSIQVSRWIRELIVTKNVKLGEEKSTNTVHEQLVQQLEEATKLNAELQNQNEWLDKRYKRLEIDHKYYRRIRNIHKLERGQCVYLVQTADGIKIGRSEDITERMSHFRTIHPSSTLLFVVYTKYHIHIERIMKDVYKKHRLYGSEVIVDVSADQLKTHIMKFVEIFMDEYTLPTEEDINKFNKNVLTEEEMKEIPQEPEEKPTITSRICCGQWHETDEDRNLPISEFYKNKSNSDGYARLCKNCYARSQNRPGYNAKLRKDKPLPDFDPTTHKWCNRCESVKSRDNFTASTTTKDGLCSNCRECKAEQKKLQKQKKINTTDS